MDHPVSGEWSPSTTVVQTTQAQTITAGHWSLPLRVMFRFMCIYWAVYVGLNVAYRFPAGQLVARWYVPLWRQFWLWSTVHLFHITGPAAAYRPTPSGDTTLQYVQHALFLLIAVGGAVAWSILDWHRTNYRQLHGWLRALLRYALALILLSYGFAKLFPQQFPPLSFARLIEPYGEFSPMGALWSFMAASRPYAVLGGAIEVTGAALLLFRRTTTLGAMVSAVAMTNVVALNLFYDVPVKLYSINILAMALFLLAPDLRRLADVLIFNRPVAAADLSIPRFDHRWATRAATVCWIVFVGYSVEAQVSSNIAQYHAVNMNAARPPLLGLYRVEGNYHSWRVVAVDDPALLAASLNGVSITVRTTDDAVLRFSAVWNGHQLTLNKTDVWTWSQPDADHVVLQRDDEFVRLRKIDTTSLPLLARGFHWLNETAFNY